MKKGILFLLICLVTFGGMLSTPHFCMPDHSSMEISFNHENMNENHTKPTMLDCEAACKIMMACSSCLYTVDTNLNLLSLPDFEYSKRSISQPVALYSVDLYRDQKPPIFL